MTTLAMHPDFRAHDVRVARACASCVFFTSDPAQLEAQMPGLNSLSSAFASVRGDDGFCNKHQRMLGALSYCSDFSGR